MSNKHAVRNFGLGVLAALAIVSAIPPMLANAGGLRDRAAAHASNAPQAFAGRGPLVIPAAAFRADGLSPSSIYFSFGDGFMQGTAAAYGCVMAPAYLPQGAIVYEVFASVYDNDATRNVNINLWRVNRDTGVAGTMAALSSAGASTVIQFPYDGSISNPAITYPLYAYYVTTCLGSTTTRLYSVRIWYYDQFLDLPLISK